jgi:hypothetical protein
MRVLSVAAAAAAVVILILSCSDQQTPTDAALVTGAPHVKLIEISPPTEALTVGETEQLSAIASPSNVAATFTWTSSDRAVATVTSAGLVTGVGPGSATIDASAGDVTGTAAITVAAAPPPPPPPPSDVVMVGAGDIASCLSSGDEATAALLDNIPGTVYTLGDNVYDSGTTAEYADCYGPTWGRHKARTRPAPGNHEYSTLDAAAYFAYFGSAAGDPSKGYYSYNLGEWHVIVLNTSLGCSPISCAAGSPQEQWLRADLAANPKTCTLAYWHHPRFNSGTSAGDNPDVGPFWNALYQMNAEVVLNGHEHVYERFAPQTPNAVADPVRGIRQFTVGTGGRSHYSFGTIQPNSEVREANTYGVLKLTLHATSYDWTFIPVAGSSFTDSGTGTCH